MTEGIWSFNVITESSKRPRIEQIPAANLDADDPIDDDDDDDQVRYNLLQSIVAVYTLISDSVMFINY